MRGRNKPWAKDFIEEHSNLIYSVEEQNELPLTLEVGIGKGDFIVANANDNLDYLHIGFELNTSIFAIAMKKIVNEDIKNIRLITIAGPSSSGKTTFSNRLRVELLNRGIKPIRLSIDNYYLERGAAPLGEDGKPDLEHIEALDIDLFNRQMLALIQGQEVTLPVFNFKTGKREQGETLKISSETPIILEGIHALNDRLTSLIPKYQKFKIFISPSNQIKLDAHNPINLSDIRLIRRLVRDFKHRGSDAAETLSMWTSVRKG